jgi:TetR/AcrR family transcriptional regulator, regulator of cefoperazone and chloramphenicol sensitivity
MKMPREDVAMTRRRLMNAAAEIFAHKGYRDATIAEICIRARANIAAVNYHFKSKEALYREAWLQSLHESLEAHPPDGLIDKNASPEDRLCGQVNALLERVTDVGNKEFLIVQQEMSNPTGLLDDVIREVIQPLKARMQAVIRELLGPEVSDMQVEFCEISIISQCINPAVMRKEIHPGQMQEDDHPRIDDIAAYARHVITFSLGGIRAILDAAEKTNKRALKQSKRKGTKKQD